MVDVGGVDELGDVEALLQSSVLQPHASHWCPSTDWNEIQTFKDRYVIVSQQNSKNATSWSRVCCYDVTSHSAYVATATKSDGVKIDGLLPPNFL